LDHPEITDISVRVLEITKYGYFSHFLTDFRELKLSLEFYDLENIYLPLWIIQKEPETIERTDIDGTVPNRQDPIKFNYIQRL